MMTVGPGESYQAVGHFLVSNNTIVDARTAGIIVGAVRQTASVKPGAENILPYENVIINSIKVERQ